MEFEILESAPAKLDEQEFREFAKLCGDENVTIDLQAAVEFVEKQTNASLSVKKVRALLQGGTRRLPYAPIAGEPRVFIVSNGVRGHEVSASLRGSMICLPSVCGPACDNYYEVTYKTKPVTLTAGLTKAIYSVALDMYDGAEVRDISALLRGVGQSKLGMFYDAIGGINPRI